MARLRMTGPSSSSGASSGGRRKSATTTGSSSFGSGIPNPTTIGGGSVTMNCNTITGSTCHGSSGSGTSSSDATLGRVRQILFQCGMLVVLIYIFGFVTIIRRVDDETNGVRRKQYEQQQLAGGSGSGSGSGNHLTPQQILEQHQAQKEANERGELVPPVHVTIGFAVTITGCGSDPITEGAAVLQHSIHLASVHGPWGGKYEYHLYAIYHPDGEVCALPLADLGYTLLKRETPVQVKDIKGDFLRQNIERNGCCGEKELVKLEAYTLVQHPVVVHLDLDVVLLKPMDELFDWMLVDPHDLKGKTYDTSPLPIMWTEDEVPAVPNAFFTRDCT